MTGYEMRVYDAINISRNMRFDWNDFDRSGVDRNLNNKVPRVFFNANDIEIVSDKVERYYGISGFGYMRECRVLYNEQMFLVEVVSLPRKVNMSTECNISLCDEKGIGKTCLYYTKF